MTGKHFSVDAFVQVHETELTSTLGDDFRNHPLFDEILASAREGRLLTYILDDMRARIHKHHRTGWHRDELAH